MSVEPLGPNPVDWAVSSAISTAVAFSVSQDTVTGTFAAVSQVRSPTSKEVTSASDVAVVVVPVVVDSGQLVSSIVPSVRNRPAQRCAVEVRAGDRRVRKVRTREVGVGQVGVDDLRAAQVRPR